MLVKCRFIATAALMLLGCSGTGAGNSSSPVGTTESTSGSGVNADPEVPGTQRATLTMDTMDIPAGAEFYKCQDFPNPFGQDAAIVKSYSKMTYGSHHMFVFRLSSGSAFGGTPNLGPNDTKGPIGDCPNGGVEFHPFVHAAQTTEQTNTYPAGIGQAFNGDEVARVAVHYLNTSAAVLHANVTIQLDYVAADQVDQLAAPVFLNALALQVPPGESVQGFSYQLPADIQLLGAASHMHKWATHFDATAIATDGSKTPLYQTDTWDEPTASAFSPPIALASGTTIHWACTYDNTTGQPITFGESAAKNEMCIFTGTYFPAPGGNGLYDQNLSPGAPN